MGEKRLLFIFNALAGKAAIKSKLSDILDIFIKAGYQVTVRSTQHVGDATAYAACHSAEFDMVVCSGGDGTLDEVVAGMMQAGSKVPLGFIPAGSTNDFAASLKLPNRMMKAAHVAVEGKPFACDIGLFNQNTFVYVAAFGVLTEVSYETPQQKKNLMGRLAYVQEGMRRLGIGGLKSYEMEVITDDTIIKDCFVFGMISNSISIGGYKRLTGKNVKLDDGLYEVTLIKQPRTPVELNSILAAMLSQDPDPEYMYTFLTSEIEFISETSVGWTLDGENGGSHKHVKITNHKQAMQLMVP